MNSKLNIKQIKHDLNELHFGVKQITIIHLQDTIKQLLNILTYKDATTTPPGVDGEYVVTQKSGLDVTYDICTYDTTKQRWFKNDMEVKKYNIVE